MNKSGVRDSELERGPVKYQGLHRGYSVYSVYIYCMFMFKYRKTVYRGKAATPGLALSRASSLMPQNVFLSLHSKNFNINPVQMDRKYCVGQIISLAPLFAVTKFMF